MTEDVRSMLALLAHEVAIKLDGLTSEQQDRVAERVAELDVPRRADIARIVEEERAVGTGDGQGKTSADASVPHEPSVPAARPFKPRFLKTERAMQAEIRETERLASVHRIEDARSGLGRYLKVRRPVVIKADAAHPPCVAAAADGGTPCARCSWLLDVPDGSDVSYIDAWLDRDDDGVGRL